MHDLTRKLPGVVSTRVGSTGGDVQNATYCNQGFRAELLAASAASSPPSPASRGRPLARRCSRQASDSLRPWYGIPTRTRLGWRRGSR